MSDSLVAFFIPGLFLSFFWIHQMSSSLLAFFQFCVVFVLFLAPSILKWNEVLEKVFPLVSVLFLGFQNHIPNRWQTCLLCCRQHFGVGRKDAFCAIMQNTFSYTIVTNILALETNALKAWVKNPPHTDAHVPTSDFQAELVMKFLLTGTHLQKRVVATLPYSPVSTLHPQVTVYKQERSWLD